MKILDKILLKKYLGKDPDKYILARNLSSVLIIIWFLMAFLSFLSISNPDITIEVVYIFIIINIALLLVQFNKINIAVPVTLIGSNIAASLLVVSPDAIFGVYEVYKLAFFQLVVLGISGLITYKQFYAYLMTTIGIIAIIFQFFFRGLKLDKALVLANFEDYIVAVILLFLSGFILGKVITQKKKTLAVLNENEDKFSKAFRTSSDSLSITNISTGEFLEWNREFENIFGYSKKELLHTSTFELGIWNELEDRKKMVEILKKDGSIRNFKTVGIKKSGGTFFGNISAEIIQINNENCVLTTVRDISKDKEIEDALRNSERNYREIFDSSSDTIFIHDADTGTILDVNNSVYEMYGYEKKEVIGKGMGALSTKTPQYTTKEAIELIRKLREKGTHIFEWQEKKKNGKLFWIEVIMKFSELNGRKRILTIARDITKRKRLQETLVQSEKMLSLGGLAAGMAHEINNPLAGIMQNAQVIVNRLKKDSPANIKVAAELGLDLSAMRIFLKERKIFNQLNRIQEAGGRAAEIVANMLKFARKESSRSSHNICELLDKTVDMAGNDYNLKKSFDFRDINIVRHYEKNLPLVVCDPGQIQQVFFNILKNGAEAMSEHLILLQAQHSSSARATDDTQEKPKFILSVRHKKKMLSIEIENNLCGIPEEIQGRIFEPFYTTKPVGVGTGLGLSVSYFIINETHNGELKVESDTNSCVKFIIELPLD